MAKTQLNKQPKTEVEENVSLKGTLVSVFVVGLIMVTTWVGVYFLYLNRF